MRKSCVAEGRCPGEGFVGSSPSSGSSTLLQGGPRKAAPWSLCASEGRRPSGPGDLAPAYRQSPPPAPRKGRGGKEHQDCKEKMRRQELQLSLAGRAPGYLVGQYPTTGFGVSGCAGKLVPKQEEEEEEGE